MNEWMILLPCDLINNWLKASLVLHTRQLKEDNRKTKTKHWVIRSPWRQSGWSPVGSPVGRRGSVVGRICGKPTVDKTRGWALDRGANSKRRPLDRLRCFCTLWPCDLSLWPFNHKTIIVFRISQGHSLYKLESNTLRSFFSAIHRLDRLRGSVCC